MGGFRGWAQALVVGLLLVMAVGCGKAPLVASGGSAASTHLPAASHTHATAPSTSHTASTHASTPPSSPPPSPAVPSTVAAVNPSNFPGCAAENLSVALVSQAVGANTHIRVYAFKNTGTDVCTLSGYPGAELLDAQGQPITTDEVQVTYQQNLITLNPEGQAWFVVQYPDSMGVNPSSCPASAELAITPPNSDIPIVLTGKAGTIRAYGSTRGACGQLDVQPVTAPGVPLDP